MDKKFIIMLIYLLLFILNIIGCDENQKINSNNQIKFIVDPIILVSRFGDKNIKDDFLLAQPGGVGVNNNGNIYTVQALGVLSTVVYFNNRRYTLASILLGITWMINYQSSFLWFVLLIVFFLRYPRIEALKKSLIFFTLALARGALEGGIS